MIGIAEDKEGPGLTTGTSFAPVIRPAGIGRRDRGKTTGRITLESGSRCFLAYFLFACFFMN